MASHRPALVGILTTNKSNKKSKKVLQPVSNEQWMLNAMKQAETKRRKQEKKQRDQRAAQEARHAAKAASAAAAVEKFSVALVQPTSRDLELGAVGTFGVPPTFTKWKHIGRYMGFFGFVLVSSKHHFKWRRTVCSCNDCTHIVHQVGCSGVVQQCTTPKSPSDHRTFNNTILMIHGLNRQACEDVAE